MNCNLMKHVYINESNIYIQGVLWKYSYLTLMFTWKQSHDLSWQPGSTFDCMGWLLPASLGIDVVVALMKGYRATAVMTSPWSRSPRCLRWPPRCLRWPPRVPRWPPRVPRWPCCWRWWWSGVGSRSLGTTVKAQVSLQPCGQQTRASFKRIVVA